MSDEWYCMACKHEESEPNYDDDDLAHCSWCGNGLVIIHTTKANIGHANAEIIKLQERIAELEARIHEAKEIYTGMEGFIAETAPEAYQQRVLNQMWAALTAGYLGEDNE